MLTYPCSAWSHNIVTSNSAQFTLTSCCIRLRQTDSNRGSLLTRNGCKAIKSRPSPRQRSTTTTPRGTHSTDGLINRYVNACLTSQAPKGCGDHRISSPLKPKGPCRAHRTIPIYSAETALLSAGSSLVWRVQQCHQSLSKDTQVVSLHGLQSPSSFTQSPNGIQKSQFLFLHVCSAWPQAGGTVRTQLPRCHFQDYHFQYLGLRLYRRVMWFTKAIFAVS